MQYLCIIKFHGISNHLFNFQTISSVIHHTFFKSYDANL